MAIGTERITVDHIQLIGSSQSKLMLLGSQEAHPRSNMTAQDVKFELYSLGEDLFTYFGRDQFRGKH